MGHDVLVPSQQYTIHCLMCTQSYTLGSYDGHYSMSDALDLSLFRPSVCHVTVLCQFLLVTVSCRLCAVRPSCFNSHHLVPGFLDFSRQGSVVRCFEIAFALCHAGGSVPVFGQNYCFFFRLAGRIAIGCGVATTS